MNVLATPIGQRLPSANKDNGKAFALALLMHGLLFAFLWVGIRWQSEQSTAVEAEIWDLTTREAAPLPVLVEPEPIPKPEPVETKIVEKVELSDPEIVLKQEKAKKELERKKEDERKKRELALQKEREKEREKAREQEKQKLLLAEKEKSKKAAADLAEKKRLEAKDKLAAEKLFKENMQRLNTLATGSGGTGSAEKSTGNNRGDPSWAAKISAKIRANTNFNPASVSGNLTVEYHIELFPDGSLKGGIRKTKSSGNSSFDDAVAKAIENSAPFPRDKNGTVPPSIDLSHRMKE